MIMNVGKYFIDNFVRILMISKLLEISFVF